MGIIYLVQLWKLYSLLHSAASTNGRDVQHSTAEFYEGPSFHVLEKRRDREEKGSLNMWL